MRWVLAPRASRVWPFSDVEATGSSSCSDHPNSCGWGSRSPTRSSRTDPSCTCRCRGSPSLIRMSRTCRSSSVRSCSRSPSRSGCTCLRCSDRDPDSRSPTRRSRPHHHCRQAAGPHATLAPPASYECWNSCEASYAAHRVSFSDFGERHSVFATLTQPRWTKYQLGALGGGAGSRTRTQSPSFET